MSYINKPGLTSSVRKMIARQQVTDVLAYKQIITTPAHAKNTQVYLEKLITLAKKDNLINRRRVASFLLTNKDYSHKEIVKHIFEKVAPKYSTRPGGYSRLLKLSSRQGDNSIRCLLQLV